MFFYRLNKKSSDGKDAWTSISDVGKVFDGVVFTIDDYMDSEGKIIELLNDVYRHIRIDAMVVRRWHKYPSPSGSPVLIPSDITVGSVVSGPVLDGVVRASLREDSWCFLTALEDLWLTVGDDYNVHIATSCRLDPLIAGAWNLGLALKQIDWLEDGMREQLEG